jgi:Tol biopolymer transport system component
MSPEQTEGAKIDKRSDLFSFGAVLFEMITGRKAFRGSNNAETLALIRRAPRPFARQFVAHLPRELDRLITACLEINPQQRPQNAQEVISTLLNVRSRLPSWESRRRTLLAILGIAAFAFTGWLGYWTLHSGSQEFDRTLPALPLTGSSSREITPSLSPDGAFVAFAAEDDRPGYHHLFIKPVDGGEAVALTSGPVDDSDPVWSPNGSKIAFQRDTESSGAAVWTVPSRGGEGHKLADVSQSRMKIPNVSGRLSWPDNRFLIVSNEQSPTETAALYRLTIATGQVTRITNPPAESDGDLSPHISPSGRVLAFVRVSTWNASSLFVLPLDRDALPAGPLRRIDTGDRRPSFVTWAGRNDELIFTAGFARHSLWSISTRAKATPRRLSVIGDDDGFAPSVSAKGTLVFTRQREDSEIWRLDLNNSSHRGGSTQQLISSIGLDLRPQYSPGGEKIAFVSLRSGYAEIWVSDADGSHAVPITSKSDPSVGDPFWAPDGKFLTFNAAPEGQYDIFKMSSTGGALTRLTHHSAMDVRPTWSHDGQWIYFASNRSGSFHIYKIASTGGEAVQVTKHTGFGNMESPDGRSLYFTLFEGDIAPLWRLRFDGGLEEPLGVRVLKRNFAAVPTGAYYVAPPERGRPPEIRFFSSQDGSTTLVHTLETDPAPGLLSVSPDGRFVLFGRYRLDSHVMIVRGFR